MPTDREPDGTRHERPGGVSGTGDPGRTARSFAALLAPADLPASGWEVVEERSWPTGLLDPASDKSKRALDGGGVTAWRKFGREGSGDSAWVEVVPYATDADAAVSLQQVPRFFVGVVAPGEAVVEERAVGDHRMPDVPETWVYEKWTTSAGGEVRARFVAGAVGRALFLVCLAGPAEYWAWAEVRRLASGQAERLARALDGPSPI